MEVEELRSLCQEFSRASKSFAPSDYAVAEKLTVVLSDFQKQKRAELIAAADGDPILQTYQSDGTSYLCAASFMASVLGLIVKRAGKKLVEFLMERGYRSCETRTGECLSIIQIGVPRSLEHGKITWHEFEAAVRFVVWRPAEIMKRCTGIRLVLYVRPAECGVRKGRW